MRTPLKHAPLLPALLLLASCATSPDGPRNIGDSTAPVPAQWQNTTATPPAAQTPDLATWWTRFNDPVLDQLITGALSTSPDIRTALSKIAESRARRGVEKSTLFPTLSGGLSARTSRSDDHTTSPHTIKSGETYSASIDASWEIDLWGKNYQSFKAADADLAQTQQLFHAAQVSLAAEVASAYITLRSTQVQLAVVEENIRTRSETTQITRWRNEAGTASALDLQQSISTLEQARATIPSLQQTIIITRNQLALLSGLPPGALDSLLNKTPPTTATSTTPQQSSANIPPTAKSAPSSAQSPAPLPSTTGAAASHSTRGSAAEESYSLVTSRYSLVDDGSAVALIPNSDIPPVDIPADTLRRRPDVRAAEFAFAAAVARTKVAERERFPSLALSGSIGLESLVAGRLFDPATTLASALGSLTAPIFTAGRIQQNIVIRNEQTKQSLIAYEAAVLTALSDVENALVSVQRTTDRLAILARAAAAAREAAELAAIQYEAGQIDLTTLLDAQRTELALREQQVSATADLSTSQIQLYKALGGGWSNNNNGTSSASK